MDKVGLAKQVLLKAQAAAKEQNERAMLWQILATSSDLEREVGNETEAEKLRWQALEIVEYISEHAGTDEVRSTFIAQPSVLRISINDNRASIIEPFLVPYRSPVLHISLLVD